jgi:hypothetical protein
VELLLFKSRFNGVVGDNAVMIDVDALLKALVPA